MKVRVIAPFEDIKTGEMHYVGDVLEWTDKKRIDDCIGRSLIEPADKKEPAEETYVEEIAKPKKTKKAKQQ